MSRISLKLRLGLASVLLAGFVALPGTDRTVVLENDFVRIAAEADQGGAISSMICKKATSFPYIADKNGQVAGSGLLFVPQLSIDGRTFDASSAAWKVTKSDRRGVTLTAPLAEFSPGLAFERTIGMDEQESGFRITDAVRNQGAGSKEIKLRFGAVSRQLEDRWRSQQRSWFGDPADAARQIAPSQPGTQELELQSTRMFWRVVGQYGVGFLYEATSPSQPVRLTSAGKNRGGDPLRFEWSGSDVVLPAGGQVSISSKVLIDEGGGPAKQLAVAAGGDWVLVSADIAGGGRSGRPLRGFATVVSARPQAIRLATTQYYLDSGSATERKTLEETPLSVAPGLAARRSFEIVPKHKGLLYLEVRALDAKGNLLASDRNYAVIDGDGMTGEPGRRWQAFVRRMPEEIYRGTWEEIGAQIAGNRHPIGKQTTLAFPKSQDAAALAFYERSVPFYAKLLKGAAAALPGKLAQALGMNISGEEDEACMNVFFDGPDGPINAYSKERSSADFKGLGYVKVVPTEGYPFHVYMKWGINSEGLASAGATLNEAKSTRAAGEKATREWKESGKHVVPEMSGMWMLLAMCKNVEEAVRFIQSEKAPLERIGNMLLVDRSGDWAVVQSVGIIHQVLRRGSVSGFPSAGNYPHEQPDGLFKIGAWGQASNTMLRERFLMANAGSRMGNLGVADVMSLMQTHGPGGMCQHIYDNPAGIYSNTASVAVTRTSDLYLTQGPPCEVETVRYTLRP